MAKCGKCDPHEICEECPEWIFTLADLIMCMMGLFVILWVLKPGPKPDQQIVESEELLDVVSEIRSAFGYVPDAGSPDPVDIHMIKKLRRMKLEGPGHGGETEIERKGAEGSDPEVMSIRQGKQAVVGGRILFESGSAELTPEAMRLLKEIAQQIRGHRNIVLVKGHSSLEDLPEDATPEQKMDLSIRRAQAAADVLTAHGVEPDILRVQGCSTFDPVLEREYTPNAHEQNRRVEVEATSTLVRDRRDPRVLTNPHE
jgi:outer membrane protein OmpA-like peptidoglycan-associated protein